MTDWDDVVLALLNDSDPNSPLRKFVDRVDGARSVNDLKGGLSELRLDAEQGGLVLPESDSKLLQSVVLPLCILRFQRANQISAAVRTAEAVKRICSELNLDFDERMLYEGLVGVMQQTTLSKRVVGSFFSD